MLYLNTHSRLQLLSLVTLIKSNQKAKCQAPCARILFTLPCRYLYSCFMHVTILTSLWVYIFLQSTFIWTEIFSYIIWSLAPFSLIILYNLIVLFMYCVCKQQQHFGGGKAAMHVVHCRHLENTNNPLSAIISCDYTVLLKSFNVCIARSCILHM